jgi:hypothetical protein
MAAELWSIPPPMESEHWNGEFPRLRFGTSALRTSSLKRVEGFPTRRVHYSNQEKFQTKKKWVVQEDNSSVRTNDHFETKTGPWMPATKHPHAYKGCAPNGMRLFDPPPSLLLSKEKKKQRDEALVSNLRKIESELHEYEASNSSIMDGYSKSLDAVTLAHGRLVRDVREMREIADLRCASRWEPGLGRRKLHRRIQPLPTSENWLL